MKGYFSINYDYYTEELQFGNLSSDIGSLGTLTDSLRDSSRLNTLIAHDVVEHAVSHRTKKFVTYEEELRAIGAVDYVRSSEGFDIYNEVLGQVEMCHRDINPVPYTIGKFLLKGHFVSTDMIRYLIVKGIKPSNARNAVYQYAWGNYQKEQQFPDYYTARNAFNFIESNVNSVLRDIEYNCHNVSGASVFFDTVKHIFRWQFKRQH